MSKVKTKVKRLCTVKGCGRIHAAKGYCHRHYQIEYLAGRIKVKVDPVKEAAREALRQRVLEKMRKAGKLV